MPPKKAVMIFIFIVNIVRGFECRAET